MNISWNCARPPGCTIGKTVELESKKLLPLTSMMSVRRVHNEVMSTLNLIVCVVYKMDERIMKGNSGHF